MLKVVFSTLAWIALASNPALAQEPYPRVKAVTLVTPFAAGAGSDLLTRILGEFLRKNLNQSVVVQNVGGAGGTIGAAQVARAAPDGYTLLLHHIGMSTAPALYKDLQFDPIKSFEPIGLFANSPYMLLSHKDFAPGNLQELVEYVRKNKDKVNFGTAGVGSGGHLCALLFEQAIGTKVTQLQYKGASLALQDLLGGRLDLMCDSPPPLIGFIKAGTLKPFVVLGGKRLDIVPNIPTASEAGYRTLDMMSIWYGLYAPAGTPKPVIERLSQALQAANQDPYVREQVAKLESTVFEPRQATPEALREQLSSQIQLWTPIIQKEQTK
jgi:tripartite-type tricarboxylate transporter receptor subunit TctC